MCTKKSAIRNTIMETRSYVKRMSLDALLNTIIIGSTKSHVIDAASDLLCLVLLISHYGLVIGHIFMDAKQNNKERGAVNAKNKQ